MHYTCCINYALFSSFFVFFYFFNLRSLFYLCFSTEFSLQLTCLLVYLNSLFLFVVSVLTVTVVTSYLSILPTSCVQFTPPLIYYTDLLLHLLTLLRNSWCCLQSSGPRLFPPHCVHFLLQFLENTSLLVFFFFFNFMLPCIIQW